MEIFVPSKSKFEALLSQDGGGIDRYIYRQSGSGLGNWFAKVIRSARPLFRSAINMLKPEMKDIGKKLVDAGANVAIQKTEELRQRAHQKLKRKRDNLDEQV